MVFVVYIPRNKIDLQLHVEHMVKIEPTLLSLHQPSQLYRVDGPVKKRRWGSSITV